MRRWSIPFVIAVIMGLALFAAWRMRNARNAAEAAIASAQRRAAAVDAEAAMIRDRLALVEGERVRLKSAADVRSNGVSVSAAATEKEAHVVTRPRDLQSFSELVKEWHKESERPEAQVRALAARRAGLADRFAPFYRRAGLSLPQIHTFEDIWMRREEQHGDLNAAAQSQGISLDDPLVVKLRGEIFGEYEKRQRETLGEVAYQHLGGFERAGRAWEIARQVAAAATVHGVALINQQIEQLVEVITSASSSYRAGGSMTVTGVDWTEVEKRLGEILTEAQLVLVRTMEPTGGGLFSAKWNGELNKATQPAKAGGR